MSARTEDVLRSRGPAAGWDGGAMVRDVQPQALPLESLFTHRLGEGRNWRHLVLPGKMTF